MTPALDAHARRLEVERGLRIHGSVAALRERAVVVREVIVGGITVHPALNPLFDEIERGFLASVPIARRARERFEAGLSAAEEFAALEAANARLEPMLGELERLVLLLSRPASARAQ